MAGKEHQQHTEHQHHAAAEHKDTAVEGKQGNIKSADDLAAANAEKEGRMQWLGMRGSCRGYNFDEDGISDRPIKEADLKAIMETFPGAKIGPAPEKKADEKKADDEEEKAAADNGKEKNSK